MADFVEPVSRASVEFGHLDSVGKEMLTVDGSNLAIEGGEGHGGGGE